MQSLINLIAGNRFARIALGATLGIGILILLFSPDKNPSSLSPTRLPPTSPRPELTELNTEERSNAIKYRTGATDALPIRVTSFMTSTGIDTDISIFIDPLDPTETVRFEITGLSYANPNTDPTANPNITAYEESFIRGLSLMRNAGLTPSRLIFIYSDIDYIRNTAQSWVNYLELL